MPQAFWNSSGPAFLDREATIRELAAIAAEAAARDPRVVRVLLFGSMATGRATSKSDADLLIVLSDHPEEMWFRRIPEYLESFARPPVPIDVFPYTSAEIARRNESKDPFLARIEAEGIELYRR